MSLDVSHLIPQSQVIDMTSGRFGNMAFGVSVTQDIWNSTSSPRATATLFHQFTLKTSLPVRDAVLKNFASKTPVNARVCKQTIIGEECLNNYTRDQKSKVTGGKAEPIQVSQGHKTPAWILHRHTHCHYATTHPPCKRRLRIVQSCLFKKCAC